MHTGRRFFTHSLMLALLGVFLMAVTQRSFGQDTNASLSGTVTDPSGAAIPGAKLTLTNEATGVSVQLRIGRDWRIHLPQPDPRQVPP